MLAWVDAGDWEIGPTTSTTYGPQWGLIEPRARSQHRFKSGEAVTLGGLCCLGWGPVGLLMMWPVGEVAVQSAGRGCEAVEPLWCNPELGQGPGGMFDVVASETLL